MRKLIVCNIISLDGCFSGPGGNVMVMPFDNGFSDYNAERLRVTLSGWFFLTLGLFPMFAVGLCQRGPGQTSATVFMVLEGVLLVLGLVMTFQAYRREVV